MFYFYWAYTWEFAGTWHSFAKTIKAMRGETVDELLGRAFGGDDGQGARAENFCFGLR